MGLLEIVTADDDADWDDFAGVDAEAFTIPVEASRTWTARIRPHLQLRVARRNGRVVGGYTLGSVGQRFGGREVPAAPVSAVAVRPEERGAGVGAALMADLRGVARERGLALAPLWAAVPRFYRRWGWGIADRAHEQMVRLDALSGLRGAGEAVRDPSLEEWLPVWRRQIEGYDGAFLAPEWALTGDGGAPDAGEHRYAIGWREAGGLTGYMQISQKRGGDHGGVVTEVIRFGAQSGDATRGLLGILGGGGGQGEDVVFKPWTLPVRNVLHFVVGEPHREILRVRGSLNWMQRVNDIPTAMAARGWDASARGRIDLAVHDPLESAALILQCVAEDGEVRVVPGGDGHVRTDIATLASWYCGSLRAVHGQRIGLISGPSESLELMDRMLPRAELWLPELF